MITSEKQIDQVGRDIVDRLVWDITSRSGLREVWESIDQETRDQIMLDWIEIVRTAVREGRS